jgi:PAS domain S-box-containing protein
MNILDFSQNDLDLKLIEYNFYQNENLLYDMAVNSNHFVIKLTNDMRILHFNKIAEKIYGWPKENVIGEDYNFLCNQFGYYSPFHNYENSNFLNVPSKFETYIPGQNGERKHLEVRIKFITNKITEEKFILMLGKNITDIKNIREKEEAVGLYLKEIFSYFPISIFSKDKSSRFLWCNDSCLNVANLSSLEDIQGKTDLELPWREEEALSFIKDDQEVINTGNPKFGIIEHLHTANGKHFTLCTSKIPTLDFNGNPIGVIGFFCDISAINNVHLLYLNNHFKELHDAFKHGKTYYIVCKATTYKLTKREAECLTHIAMGKTVKEAAKLLVCSPKTVEAHINKLKPKLGGVTTKELISYFWSNPIKWF